MKKQIFQTIAGEVRRIGYDSLFDMLPKELVKLGEDKTLKVTVNSRNDAFRFCEEEQASSGFIKIGRTLLPILSKERFIESQLLSYRRFYQKVSIVEFTEETLEDLVVKSIDNFGAPSVLIKDKDRVLILDISHMKIAYYVDPDDLEVRATLVNNSPVKSVLSGIKKMEGESK